MCDNTRSTHELNKREMFDGMRAYHQSELSHKSDAISILGRIVALAAAVYGVLIGIATSPEVQAAAIIMVSTISGVAICFIIYRVVKATNNKIYQDHLVYWKYGNEYVKESRRLGLMEEETVYGYKQKIKDIDPAHPPGSGKGYEHTQKIIRETGVAIAAFVIIGVLITMLVAISYGK